MDSSNVNRGTDSIEKEHPNSFYAKRARFFEFYNPHQIWSLPENIIYYISKNPSTAKAYQKMIQSSKYFFVQKPLLILPNSSVAYLDNKGYISVNNEPTCPQRFTSKIWIIDEFKYDVKEASFLQKYIYQCDAKFCEFRWCNILFNDFIFLASKCKKIRLVGTTIKNDDDSIVTLEKIIEVLPNVKDFQSIITSPTIISPKTAQELLKISHFSKLDKFSLDCIPETFDIKIFFDYIKKNKKTKIDLDFHDDISQQYETRLGEVVYEIIRTENRDYKVPVLNFRGIGESYLIAMELKNLL